jgi:hypothetical protein
VLGLQDLHSHVPVQRHQLQGRLKVAYINEALQGLRHMRGRLPVGTIKQNLFEDEEIYEEIKGVLNNA